MVKSTKINKTDIKAISDYDYKDNLNPVISGIITEFLEVYENSYNCIGVNSPVELRKNKKIKLIFRKAGK